MNLGCLCKKSTKILRPPPPSPPPPLPLSLFTAQTLHPALLQKRKPHHVFLPTYGRAEADDAQRLNYSYRRVLVWITRKIKLGIHGNQNPNLFNPKRKPLNPPALHPYLSGHRSCSVATLGTVGRLPGSGQAAVAHVEPGLHGLEGFQG